MSDSSTPDNPDTSAENMAAMRTSNEALARELAFTKAGIDTDSPQGKVLMSTFEGKLEVDAIKAYRTEIFGEPAAPAETTPAATATETEAASDPYATEVAGAQSMRDTLAQGQPGAIDLEPPTKNVIDDAMENFHNDRKAGVPQDRAALAAVDRFIVAGVQNSPDVIFDPQAWEQKQAEAGHKPKQMQV